MISQKTRASLTVIVTFLLVIVGTLILVAVASGYNIDIFSGEISSRGLVKLNTNPSGATISINSKNLKQKTPYQLENIKTGPIKVEYQKDGYHSWSSNFTVEGGVVTFADYALLIPSDIEVKQIDSNIQMSGFIANSDNSKLFATSDSSAQIYEVQRNFQLKKIADIPLNASIKTANKLTDSLTNDEGSAIITRAEYPDSKPVRFWVGVSGGSVANIDDAVGAETKSLTINPRNYKEIFGINSGQLVRFNTDSKNLTKLAASNINTLYVNKNYIYTLENLSPASNGQFLVRYDFNGSGRYVIAQYPPATSAWTIRSSKLNGVDYLSLLNPADGSLFVVKNDGQKITSSLVGVGVSNSEFSQSGRFLSFSQNGNFRTIDIEFIERYSKANSSINSIHWFTDYQLLLYKADGTYIVDYDGENLIKLPPNFSDTAASKINYISDIKAVFFTSSGRINYYSLQPKGSLINF